MTRSLRLRRSAIHHGFIAATGLMVATAGVTWMCAALLYEAAGCAVVALCVAALAAFVAWVEGTEAARLHDLARDEMLREMRNASFFHRGQSAR